MSENNNNPLVTVQLTCYNHEKYVRRAIDSVMKGTYENFELYISDDGSTDSSREIINQAYEDYGRDGRIHLFLKNENTCFQVIDEMRRHYKGKYLCTMGADDSFMPNKIEKQVVLLENNKNYKACFTYVQAVGDKVEKNDKYDEMFNRPLPESRFDICNWLLVRGNRLNAPSVMIDREVFEELGGYDFTFRILQDYRLWIKLCQKYDLCIIEEPLTCYGVVSGSLSTDFSAPNRVRCATESIHIFYDEIKNMKPDVFEKVFPEPAAEKHTEADIYCRKMQFFMMSRFPYIKPLALRFFYENVDNKDFVNRLAEKYNIGRKEIQEMATHGEMEQYFLNTEYKLLFEHRRFRQALLDKSNEELVENLCDMIDGVESIKPEITLDHICALYETCKNLEDGKEQFAEFISELVKRNISLI